MEVTMKNIVFIVESFYRTPSANGICVQNIANELVLNDNIVSVLTSFRDTEQPHEEYINGIYVKRFWRSILDCCCVYFQNRNYFFYRLCRCLIRVKQIVLTNLWPLSTPLLIFKYYYIFRKLNHKQSVDVVVGVYLRVEEIIAALLIKKIFPQIKCIIYSLDAMGGRVPKE